MPFQLAVIFYSKHGLLPLSANVIAEGARKVKLLLLLLPHTTSDLPFLRRPCLLNKDWSGCRFPGQRLQYIECKTP